MEINESISISQSPEKMWDYLALVTTDVQWREGITKAELTSPPPYGIGSTGVHYHKDLGAFPWTVVKWDEGRHMEWVHRESKLEGTIAFYHVEPEKDGSTVTLYIKMVVPFLMRIAMVFMRGKIVKGIKTDLKKLKTIMEAGIDK